MGYFGIQFSDSIEFDVVNKALKQMHLKKKGPGVYSDNIESDEEVAEYLVEICREWMINERKEWDGE